MKFFKPSWVGHDGNPIFSVDIHPDGTRFATGGQGPEKCGRVIIWNMAPILSPKDEAKDDVPKKLCQMDNHLACINCVRWSNQGKYLASAGDDKNLMVWQLAGRVATHHHSNSQAKTNNLFDSPNIEQWRCIATLNGHDGDILDLAWSAHDQHLASCSVDNMIIVWDANNFPQLITKITGHTGLVKGVSWDPAGKYLASQSDDKTVRVWRTNDWREETVVKEPFRECGGTTHVLRLNWSPDGQTLVSAHAMNNSGSVAQLIERDGWKTQRDLVGHRKAVTCVRFNPNLLYQNKPKKQAERNNPTTATTTNNTTNNNNIISGGSSGGGPNSANSSSSNNNINNLNNSSSSLNNSINNNNNNSNSNGTISNAKSGGAAAATTTTGGGKSNSQQQQQLSSRTIRHCCIAIGSRDRSISVWLTSQPRPLIVAHDLFESSVLDISWSKDGYRLMACSQDGTVATMTFTPSEIGHKLTSEERQAHFQKLYGKSITAAPTTSKTIIVEDPELIKVDQSQKHREMLDQQQSSHSNSISQNGYNGCESNTSMSGMSKGPTDRQIETLLPGGKRRITPLYIQPPLPFNSTSSITFSSSKESKTKILIETTTSTPPTQTPTPGYMATTPIKQNQHQQQQHHQQQAATTAATAAASSATIPTIKCEHIIPNRTNQKTLAPSRIDKATVFRIIDSYGRDLTLEAENDTNSDKLNELRLLDETNNKIWDVLLSSKIISVIATQYLAASSCMDNSLHLFELHSGRRLIPPLILDSQVAHIAAEQNHLLVITSNAHMWLWDLKQNKVLVRGESVSPILSQTTKHSTTTNEKQSGSGGSSHHKTAKSNEKTSSSNNNQNNNNTTNNNRSGDDNNQNNHEPTTTTNRSKSSTNNKNNQSDGDIEILSCSLTAHFQPILLLSTGKAFVFDYNLHCWLLISDSNDSITRWSSCKPSLTAMKRFLQNHKQVDLSDEQANTLKKNLPLASLQSQHSFDIKRFANLINKNGSESLQVKATRSYLDQQLASSIAIKSAHEYHYWLLQSVQHYVDTGAENRLKDLCSRLISSTFGGSAGGVSGSNINSNNRTTMMSGDDSGREDNNEAPGSYSNANHSDNNHSHHHNHHHNHRDNHTDITNAATTTEPAETSHYILGLNKLNLLREVLSILSKDLRYQRIYSEYKQLIDYDTSLSSLADMITDK